MPVVASSTSSEAAIRSGYTKLQRAFLENDAAAVSAILAPDFEQHNADGSVETRDFYIEEQTENTRGLLLSSLKFDVTSFAANGSDARAEITYAYSGNYTAKGTSKPFSAVIHVTDEWALVAGTWKLRSTTIHDLTSYVDGKVVQREREQLAPSKAAIDELRTRAVVIPTLALDGDPGQFAAIGEAIGSARIVGMGEGSHGSSEFFAFKDRLFKYLVERKAFTVFAMEAYWGAGLNVDRYIKTGQGSAQQAVASLGFWTWNTPEVLDLVRWMHDYNAAGGNHPILSFVGLDMQDPMGAIGYLAQYLRAHDPAEVVAAEQAFQCSVDAVAQPRAKPADDCREQVAAIGKQLASSATGPDVAIAQQAVTNIIQYLEWRSVAGSASTQTRDRDMAKNLEWVAETYPAAKIAVWAHNGHVGTTPELSYRPMGSYLREAFGSDYYVIGQTFGGGTVRAIVRGKGLQSVTVPLNPGDTLTELFAPLDAAAFLDLRGLPAGSPLQSFFSTQRDIEEIGAVIDPVHPDQRMPAVVPNSFDGLVYVPTSSASVSGTGTTQMEHEVRQSWTTAGAGFDDVTVSATSTQATLTNRDALNATPNSVMRRFDAMPYAGRMVRVTGEIRSDDLVGFFGPMADAKAPNDALIALSQGNAVSATSDGGWVPIALTLKVPQNASSIYAGIWAEGLGSVEVRDLRIDDRY